MTRTDGVDGSGEPVPDLRWPGVLVVGGGVTGLLTALELDRRGIAALVIDQAGMCSGQTGQCHGWLHRGGVFPDARTEDFERLDRGARQWTRLFDQASDSGIDCYVGGSHEQTRTAVTAVWDHLGLPHPPPETGAGWRVLAPESAVVPVNVLRTALTRSRVALRHAQAVSLQPERDGVRAKSMLVRSGHREFRLHADAFVLANGAGIAATLPEATLGTWVNSRLSFMLVVQSSAVDTAGIAIPEQEALGLFAVPRAREGRTYLLVSNFISYTPTMDITHSRANWLAGIGPTLQRFLPDLWTAVDALWGVYSAVKVEPMRRLALGVSGMALLPTGFENVAAGVPGKLVLGPLLAEQLAAAVAAHSQRSQDRPESSGARRHLLEQLLPPRWGPEEWEITPLVRRSTLFPVDAQS